MKDNPKNQGQALGQPVRPAPQLAVRTDLRAGANSDEGCEAGVSYWRKELNYWKQMAQKLGCA
jgi:hypothetical protein